MKGINVKTRRLHEYHEKNAGYSVAYWGQVRTWKEGVRYLAEYMLESLYFGNEMAKLEMLVFRLKWLWDREHFLEPEETKTLESFYTATFKELVTREKEFVDNLNLQGNGDSI